MKYAMYLGPVYLSRQNDIRVSRKTSVDGIDARIWTGDNSYWKEQLERVVPKLNSVGLLDELAGIFVGDDIIWPKYTGYYNDQKILVDTHILEQENDDSLGIKLFASDPSVEYLLVHEAIHHGHLHLNEFDGGNRSPPSDISYGVSSVASKDLFEAVAEIGCAIYFDVDIPEKWHDMYKEWDGPMEIYDV